MRQKEIDRCNSEIDALERRIRHAQKEIKRIQATMPCPFVAPKELEYCPGGNENIYFTDAAGNTFYFKGQPGDLDNG